MLTPIADYIVLRRLGDSTRHNPSSLIVRVQEEASECKLCEVIAVGPGRFSDYSAKLVPMPDIAEGDLVLTHSGAGTPLRHGGEPYHVVRASAADIIAVVARKSEREAVPGALDPQQLALVTP